MKITLAWIVLIVWIAAAVPGRSQGVLVSTNVDYLTLNLNIALTAATNGTPDTNGSIVSSKSGTLRINSGSIIDLLSGRRSFPLGKIVNGQGNTVPHRGPAVRTNYSNAARLLLMQGLGTNHGSIFVVIRDGRQPVDYDVSEYFSFNTRGFSPATDDTVASTNHFDLETGEEISTRILVNEFSFDDTPANPNAPDRFAFTVDGFTTEQTAPVSFRGPLGIPLIDPGATRFLTSTVAGTGIITNTLAVLKGSIVANRARHESK
jgi:hypothetical protein